MLKTVTIRIFVYFFTIGTYLYAMVLPHMYAFCINSAYDQLLFTSLIKKKRQYCAIGTTGKFSVKRNIK